MSTINFAELHSKSNHRLQVRLIIFQEKNIKLFSWWTGRDLRNYTYWHGIKSEGETGCACASTASCVRYLKGLIFLHILVYQKYSAIRAHPLDAIVMTKELD